MEPHLIRVAEAAAEEVAYGAPGHLLHGYVRTVAARVAKDWNERTRLAAGISRKDAFDDASASAPAIAQGVVADVAGFAKVDTAERVAKRTKTWHDRSRNPRRNHLAMDGVTVPVGDPFPNGMMWPGGPNCQCDLTFGGPDSVDVEPLRLADFDIPPDSLTRTRAVTNTEYQGLAAEGKALLARWRLNRSRPAGLDDAWDDVRGRAWDSVQEAWGGVTVDAHTGRAVAQGAKKFAITIKRPGQTSVSVPLGATRDEFDRAMDEARRKFGGAADGQLWDEKTHLGVFRDEDAGRIDIDPVLVVDSLAEVERVGAASRSAGGAYSFSDGLGYWPPHVD